jgi:hypothetical protein
MASNAMRPQATRSQLCCRLAASLLAVAGAVPAAVADGASDDPASAGIWKAVVPRPGAMHGAFDSNDPLGLTAGVKIKADCSINWVDPDEGRLYCFSSATSLVVFLEAPRAYLERARAQWRELGGGG